MNVTVAMPSVSKCTATSCAYNVNKGCHARAITIGDASTPLARLLGVMWSSSLSPGWTNPK